MVHIRNATARTLLVLLIVALAVSACAPAATPTTAPQPTTPAQPTAAPTKPPPTAVPQKLVIKSTYWPGPESDAAKFQFDYFNKYRSEAAGFTVEMVLFGRDQQRAKQEAMMAAQSDEVDIYYFSTRGLAAYSQFYTPLNDLLHDPTVNIYGNDETYFVPAVIQQCSFNGKWYGIPTDFSGNWVYYRTDYINKLLTDSAWIAKYKAVSKANMGVEMTPKPPDQWNWDDFKATAFFFTKKYNPDSPTQYGTFTQGKVMGPTAFLHSNMLWDFGGDWWDKNFNITMNTPAAKTAVQFGVDMWKLGLTPESSLVGEYDEADQAFKTSSVAFMLQWNAAYPELDDPKSPVHGLFDVVAPPAGPNGRFMYTDAQALQLNKYSKHPKEAARFLAWLCTQEANMLLGQHGGVPGAGPVLAALAEQRPDFPKLGRDIAAYGRGFGPYVRVFEAMVCQSWANAWSGQQTVDQMLAELQTAMETEKKNRGF